MPNGSVIVRGERINASAQAIRDWRLEKCFLYVTLEPCPMRVGAVDTLYKLFSDPRLNHRAYTQSRAFCSANAARF